jgi:signal transduction histidine kinase
LVVDDQEEVLLSTRSLLDREGYRVLTAEGGVQALQLLKEERVDLLLVDYFMPRMTGEQLVRAVRTFDPFVQIILQTGYAGDKPPRGTLADLDIQGYHDKADGPEKLLVWVAAGLKAQQLVNRAREYERRVTDRTTGAAFRVLFVGPDATTAVGHDQIKADGYRVLHAPGTSVALDMFVRERPEVVILDDSFFDQSGADLIRRARALEPMTAVIGQCNGLDPRQRRTVRQSLGLFALHDKREEPARLLEVLESAVDGARRMERMRADQSLRGLILAKLCHELRSHLHVVQGYTELLGQSGAVAAGEPLLSRLGAASNAACELVQTYLDLAHLESAAVPVRRELVDIDELVAELSTHVERQIGTQPLRFVSRVTSPGAVLLTDGEKVRAILTQLVNNAIKLGAAGTIELAVSFAREQTDFVLTDTVSYVSANDLSHLFQPFRQGDDTLPVSTPGQGLGLAIALRLSQLLGATLSAECEPRGGAIVTLSLPVGALGGARGADAPTMH